MKKVYTIIAGVNGVGKSAFTGLLKNERDDLGIIINVDEIVAKEAGGSFTAGGKLAVERIRSAIDAGQSLTQETTLSGRFMRKTMLQAKEQGYTIRLHYIGLNDAYESVIRIRNRVLKGGHDIDSDDVKRRFEKRFTDLLNVIPLCDEVMFYNNENGFDYVAHIEAGEYTCLTDEKPDWLIQFEQACL